jgi:hypothetical protein
MYQSMRYHFAGYEVSSRGDKRFSAFYARLADGRSIEEHYQCDVKGYDPGGTNWRLGKGRPPLDNRVDTWRAYLDLWRQWSRLNPELIEELKSLVGPRGILTDRFASTKINQAAALAQILNESLHQYKKK